MTVPIPQYPAARPLQLSDRSMLLELFGNLQPQISELSFANLYLFRHVHRYQLAVLADSLIISGSGYNGQPYFLPPVSGDAGAAARRMLQEGKILYGADEGFVGEHLFDSRYAVAADRDNDDYLYLCSDLAGLSGKRFHKKKNRINYFTARHSYTVEPFCKAHLQSARQLLHEWSRVHSAPLNRSLPAETAAASEGLELAEELGLAGVVVLTDTGVAAFALGEQLNDSTVVCHFEKADPFLEGAAQLVNREFCRRVAAAFTYLNREQDLGESGLREAKSSYQPVDMIRKFTVRLKA